MRYTYDIVALVQVRRLAGEVGAGAEDAHAALRSSSSDFRLPPSKIRKWGGLTQKKRILNVRTGSIITTKLKLVILLLLLLLVLLSVSILLVLLLFSH